MNQQLTFGDNLSLAERNKEQGIKASVEHADAKVYEMVHGETPRWSDRAMRYFKDFLAITAEEFLAEDVRKFATELGLPEPPSQRAWGAVIRRAKDAGLIKFAGYARTTNPRAHRTPATLWARTERT